MLFYKQLRSPQNLIRVDCLNCPTIKHDHINHHENLYGLYNTLYELGVRILNGVILSTEAATEPNPCQLLKCLHNVCMYAEQ